MSVFVLIPLSKLISKNDWKKTFIFLSVIRIAILLFFDFFITTSIVVVDFVAVFFGALIIMPMSFAKGISDSSPSIPINPQNVSTVKNTGPSVLIDTKYLNNEKKLLKDIVIGEFEDQGENAKEFMTAKIIMKNNIIILMFGLLTFIFMLMFFFNIELIICLAFEAIAILVYKIMIKRSNIVETISRYAIKNPDEDISKMVAEAKLNKKQAKMSIALKTGLIICLALLMTIVMFPKPKLLYTKYGDGYAVAKYTKGLIKQSDFIEIPETYNGKEVLAIGNGAFKNTSIKGIELPDTITSIEYKAFYKFSF